MFVSEISAASVQQIYEFRSLIDGYAARLAATRATPAEMDDLTALHEALVDATERDDIDTYVVMDRLFYEVLANAAQNVYLAEVIPRIFNLHLRLWFFISKKVGGWHSIARSHEEMTRGVADAIRRRNPNEAEIAMKAYESQRAASRTSAGCSETTSQIASGGDTPDHEGRTSRAASRTSADCSRIPDMFADRFPTRQIRPPRRRRLI